MRPSWSSFYQGRAHASGLLGPASGLTFIKFGGDGSGGGGFFYYSAGASSEMLYTVPLNTWTHLAVVKNGTSFTYYANGVQVATMTSSLTMPSLPLFLGVDPNYDDVAYPGSLDDIRLYSRALSVAEIGALANQTPISTISPPVEVDIVGANGQLDTAANGTVTLSLGSRPGALSGTLSVTATNGVAIFSSLSIALAGSDYTLVATASDVTESTRSDAFQVLPGAPAQLTFTTPPGSTTTGSTIAPAVVVSVLDSAGNLVSDGTSVTVALGANPGGATLSGTLTTTTVSGLATFSNLALNEDGVGYTLIASTTNLASATSTPFDVTASANLPPATLELTFAIASRSGPSVYELTLGATFSPAVQTGSLAGTDPVGLVAQTGDGVRRLT
jgi:Concanavalin A-like lectin/glucanases superfamily